MPTGQRVDRVRKIAVVRANGIGDYCFAVPALAALRAAYPAAEIVLLAKRWHHDFLRERPGPIDRIIAVPSYGGVSVEPGEPENRDQIEEFFAAMQEERFDLALQLHGGGRYSNPFTQRLKARVTAGLQAPEAPALDRVIPYIYFQPEVLRYLEVVALVGASPVTLEPSIAVTPADEAEVEALGLGREPLAVLHPGATDPRRRWPAENFAAVGRAMVEAGARVAIIGSGEERPLVSAVAQGMAGAPLDLCNRLTLGGLAALLARSRVVISNDSGPLHLAAAVGAVTVGIYWCGNMINGGPTTRRRHRPCISWRLNCPLCNRNTLFDNCAHRASFVADVALRDVVANALQLWCEQPKQRSIAA